MVELVRVSTLMNPRKIVDAGGGSPAASYELREDGGYELREDGGIELREDG